MNLKLRRFHFLNFRVKKYPMYREIYVTNSRVYADVTLEEIYRDGKKASRLSFRNLSIREARYIINIYYCNDI